MSVQEMAKIMRPGLCKIVEENEMNNGALLRAAHKHNIFELKEYCTEYLKHKISLENATDILVSLLIERTFLRLLQILSNLSNLWTKKKVENWSSQICGKN